MQKYELAIKESEKLLQYDPKSSQAYGICGHIFLDKGEYIEILSQVM